MNINVTIKLYNNIKLIRQIGTVASLFTHVDGSTSNVKKAAALVYFTFVLIDSHALETTSIYILNKC